MTDKTEILGATPINETNEKEVNRLIYLLGLPKTGEYFLDPAVREKFKILKVKEREYIGLIKDSERKLWVGRYDGSFEDKSIAIKDMAVSKKHCLIGYNPEIGNQLAHFYVVDLGSSNGTEINGVYYDDQWQKQEGKLVLSKDAPAILPLYAGESNIISFGKLGMNLEFRVIQKK